MLLKILFVFVIIFNSFTKRIREYNWYFPYLNDSYILLNSEGVGGM